MLIKYCTVIHENTKSHPEAPTMVGNNSSNFAKILSYRCYMDAFTGVICLK